MYRRQFPALPATSLIIATRRGGGGGGGGGGGSKVVTGEVSLAAVQYHCVGPGL